MLIVWLSLIGGLLIIVLGYGSIPWLLREPPEAPGPPASVDPDALARLRHRVHRG